MILQTKETATFVRECRRCYVLKLYMPINILKFRYNYRGQIHLR